MVFEFNVEASMGAMSYCVTLFLFAILVVLVSFALRGLAIGLAITLVEVKEWDSGEEFIFDGIRKVPVLGAVYAVLRTLTYGLSGNKRQSEYSAQGFVDNIKDSTGYGAKLIIAPIIISANVGSWLINKVVSRGGQPEASSNSIQR